MSRARGAYLGGTFDLLHPGHIALFRRAKELFGRVVVALNTDEFCARYKRVPIMCYQQRKAMLEACRYVDEVVENAGSEDSRPSILASGVDVIVHGDDWTGEQYLQQLKIDQKFLDDNSIHLVYLPYTKGISTSDIIARCRAL